MFADKVSRGDKIYIFNFLRVFGCVGVLLHHLIEVPFRLKLGQPEDWMFNSYFSGIFMEAFFFTTGFLIPLSLSRCSVKQFLIKRFFRLFPVLALFIIIYCLVFLNNQIGRVLRTLFMIGDLFYIQCPRNTLIIGEVWSMQVELKFYLLSALAFFLFRGKKCIYFIVFLTSLMVLLVRVFHLPNNFACSLRYCVCLVPMVLLGSVYYFYKAYYLNKIEFITLYLFCLFLSLSNLHTIQAISYTIGAIFSLFMVIKFETFGDNKIIKYIANLSYGIYLSHRMWQRISYKVFFSFDTFGDFTKTISLVLFFLIPCFLLCHVVYNVIEKPCYNFGRKLAERYN